MTSREELIADARRDIADAERCQALHITPATGTILRRLREVTNALAVFEKAHAPTDTTIPQYAMLDLHMALYGIEADFDAFYREHGYAEAWARLLADVRESRANPTDDEREAPTQELCERCGWALSGHLRSQYGRDCPPGGARPGFGRSEVPEPSTEDEIDPEECKACGEVGDEYRCVAEPQGEPSDVQELLAEADALVEAWDRKGSWSADSPVGMVMRLARALRDAGGVR